MRFVPWRLSAREMLWGCLKDPFFLMKKWDDDEIRMIQHQAAISIQRSERPFLIQALISPEGEMGCVVLPNRPVIGVIFSKNLVKS